MDDFCSCGLLRSELGVKYGSRQIKVQCVLLEGKNRSAVRAQAWGWRRLCGGISTQDWNLRDEGKKWEGGQEKNVRIRQLTCKILERTSISWGSGKSRKRKAGAFPARSVMAFENFINSFVVHACRIRGCGLHCYFLPLCTRRQWE